jgi:hypothetical protein
MRGFLTSPEGTGLEKTGSEPVRVSNGSYPVNH